MSEKCIQRFFKNNPVNKQTKQDEYVASMAELTVINRIIRAFTTPLRTAQPVVEQWLGLLVAYAELD